MNKRVTAEQVIKALELRHREDVTVPELTLGPAGSRRLDFWALKKSWSPIQALGYEIKVSRSDFMQDEKWHAYRDACHHFFFVCPWKMIMPEELPEGVGLMWLTNTGKLQTKRKAARHNPDLSVFQMALVRACWGPMYAAEPTTRLERAERHHERVKSKDIGRMTAVLLGTKNRESFDELYRKTDEAQKIAKKLQYVNDWAERNGIDLRRSAESNWGPDTSIKDQLNNLLSGVDKGFMKELSSLRTQIDGLVESAKKAQEKVA